MPCCQMVWLAPVPTRRSGRSALITASGVCDMCASITAGYALATAVPEVITTATWRRCTRARPRAVKAAERSSMRMCTRTSRRAKSA